MKGFHIENGAVNEIKILDDYNDDFWCVDSNKDTVFLIHSISAGSYINKTPSSVIEVEAGAAKIILSFNSKSQKYYITKSQK